MEQNHLDNRRLSDNGESRLVKSDRWADLPPANTTRWVARRKAAIVEAVVSGRITLQEACERYQLSEEEFKSWRNLVERHGVTALKATRLKRYRDADSRGSGS